MEKTSDRQSFLGPDSDEILRQCRVAIIGLSGGGSHVAQQLAHIGIGKIYPCDYDRIEPPNLNRMVSATEDDARQQAFKVAVIKRLINGIRLEITVVEIPTKWQEHAELLRDCTTIFGCVDSFSERSQLEIFARRYLIPYIDIGMDVHDLGDQYAISGQVILSMPGQLCMRCIGFLTDDLLSEEGRRYGAAGSRPQVVWPNGVLASLAIGVFIQIVTPWHQKHAQTVYLEYDGNAQTVQPSNKLKMMEGRACPHFAKVEDLGDPFWDLSK